MPSVFCIYLLDACCVSDTLQGPGDTSENKSRESLPCSSLQSNGVGSCSG